VDFSIDIENGTALRHAADLFHVETSCPRAVKNKKGQTSRSKQAEQADLPAVAKKFALPDASEKFHGKKSDNLATNWLREKLGEPSSPRDESVQLADRTGTPSRTGI